MAFSQIEEIKSRLDIVEVIGSYIKLQKAGVNYRALCPFHSEKTPSFFVSPARQIWHCFGCGKGGDIFKFVMEIEGVEFGDALKILARRAGVELKPRSPEWKKFKTKRQKLYEICDLAARFFQKQLEGSKIGISAKNYLLKRGISDESIRNWGIGYAPSNWKGLSGFLISRGYRIDEVEEAGLVVKNRSGNFYDRFRGRIIFPIFDLNDQIIGFTGRVFVDMDKDNVSKYVNTPNTLLYDKSRVLYGLNKAKMAIRKNNRCILVEGQTDVIMSHQSGVREAVATSGTALTTMQLKILKRYSDNLVTAFDMDIAGNSATKRGIDLAQTQGFNIMVVTMEEGLDPADIVHRNPDEWKRLVSKTHSILDFYFKSAFSRFDPKTPEGEKEISNILVPIIRRIPNRIVQSHWIGELARKLDVKEESIEDEIKKYSSFSQNGNHSLDQKSDYRRSFQKSRRDILEERIISLVLRYPETISLIEGDHFNYFSDRTKMILEKFKESPSHNFSNNIKNYGFSPEVVEFLNVLSLRAEVSFDLVSEGKNIPEPEMLMCLKELYSIVIRNRLDEISKNIKKMEEKGDIKKADSLAQQFSSLAKKLTANFYEDKNKTTKD